MLDVRRNMDDLRVALSMNGYEIIEDRVLNGLHCIQVKHVKGVRPVWILANNEMYNIRVGYQIALTIPTDLGKKGLTHLFEHCMFHQITTGDGTVLTADEFWEYTKEKGLYVSANTLYDGLNVFGEVEPIEIQNEKYSEHIFDFYPHLKQSDNLSSMRDLIDTVTSVTFRGVPLKESFDKEQKIVTSEIRLRQADNSYVMYRAGMDILSDAYDFAGTVEDVEQLTFDDVKRMREIATNNVISASICVDLSCIPANFIVDWVNMLNSEMVKNITEVVDYMYVMRHITSIESINRRFTSKISYNYSPLVHLPLVNIFCDMNGLPEKLKKNLGSWIKLFRFTTSGSLSSYFVQEFREKLSRCYNVGGVSIPSYDVWANNNSPMISFYWQPQDTECDIDENFQMNPNKLNLLGMETIDKEITKVMNNINITEQQFNSSIKDTLNNILLALGKSMKLDTHTIILIDTGAFDIDVINSMDKEDITKFTYGEFCEFVKYIKNNWKAQITFKTNQ